MKTTRYKKARKNLGFYINNYKFRQPFQILIDGTFAFVALQNKFNIQEQIPKYFQSEVKFLTTPCVITETEKLGSHVKTVNAATNVVKQYAVHKCKHEKESVSGLRCLTSMVGKDNSSRYIIATQDRELQDKLRNIPGVPILYLHGKTPMLESPSETSRIHAEVVQKSLGMTIWEKENIKLLREQAGIAEQKGNKLKKRKKGPNPLSCLKKKKKPETKVQSNNVKSGKVRKKKKIKIAAHIKAALTTELNSKHEK